MARCDGKESVRECEGCEHVGVAGCHGKEAGAAVAEERGATQCGAFLCDQADPGLPHFAGVCKAPTVGGPVGTPL